MTWGSARRPHSQSLCLLLSWTGRLSLLAALVQLQDWTAIRQGGSSCSWQCAVHSNKTCTVFCRRQRFGNKNGPAKSGSKSNSDLMSVSGPQKTMAVLLAILVCELRAINTSAQRCFGCLELDHHVNCPALVTIALPCICRSCQCSVSGCYSAARFQSEQGFR